jgi:hypothetical protein
MNADELWQFQKRAIYAGLLLAPATLAMMIVLSVLTGSPGNVWFAVFSWSFLGIGFFYYLFPVVIFFIVGASLFRARSTVPAYSMALGVVAAAGVVWYFVESWSYGLQYQDYFGLVLISYANVAVLVTLIYLAVRSHFQPSFRRNLLFHWLLVFWLASGAFPYMGEVL